MLRFLVTVIVVYLILIFVQSSVCRTVNGVIVGQYWWMCGDRATQSAPKVPGGIFANPIQVIVQIGQWFGSAKTAPVWAVGAVSPDHLKYMWLHWCWRGIL